MNVSCDPASKATCVARLEAHEVEQLVTVWSSSNYGDNTKLPTASPMPSTVRIPGDRPAILHRRLPDFGGRSARREDRVRSRNELPHVVEVRAMRTPDLQSGGFVLDRVGRAAG